MRTNTLQITTPEGIVFSQWLAGPVVRFFAWGIDLLCILALLSFAGSFATVVRVVSNDLAMAAAALSYFVISIGYGMTCEWFWRGQTVGKKLFRLRVMDEQGLRLRFSQVVVRNLLRFVDALPFLYLVGGVICWFDPLHRRLGDLAAGTVVVRNPRHAQPDLEQLLAGKFNSLRNHPHLEARLRQRVVPGEAAAALQALLRRDDFDPTARVELYAGLAAHFRDKVEFPAETIDGITDEQFLRNVVDVVYRTGRNSS
jgi:uncharacterized RDD family membrane protein YckC